MKSDILERLLMDQSLGHLEPDVEALLADYLADNPSAATQSRELQDVVKLATEVVRQPLSVVEMPIRIDQLVWRHRTQRILALTASFVVGVGLTLSLKMIGKSSSRKRGYRKSANDRKSSTGSREKPNRIASLLV